ncbi:MAG: sigma-70 family RNA polymerase sigma factor [Planctomycetota bacterium]
MIPDEKLVSAYLEGDGSALDILLDRYQKRIWNLSLSLSFNKEKSFIDDISQEVLLRMFKRIREFTNQGEGSFRKWVYQLCRNVCKESNRRLGHRQTPLSELYPENLPDYLNTVRPEPAYERTAVNDKVADLLSRLTEEERRLIMLLYEHKTYEQIQQIQPFGKYTIETLRQKTCRLRKYLIQLYKNATTDKHR